MSRPFQAMGVQGYICAAYKREENRYDVERRGQMSTTAAPGQIM